MRLLFLAIHDRDVSPSQRYRFEAMEPALRAAGFDITYSPALRSSDARDFYGRVSARRKAMIALKALARRGLSLAQPADVVFVQREAFFMLNEWSEWLARLRAPMVFDFDDAIWMPAISEANRRFGFLKNFEKVGRTVKLAHTVLAGNSWLAAWARQFSSNVHVVPTVVDTERFKPPATRRAEGPVTIGWSGSPSTFAHLRLLLPALERLKARFGDRIRIRVMGDPAFHHAPLNLRGETWTPAEELKLLEETDISVMPVPDEEWSLGKCGLKGLVAMASGAATVMSPVGVGQEIVQHGVNGMLATTENEWVDAVAQLVERPTLRLQLGAAGRQRVVEHYSVERWAPVVTELVLAATRSAKGAA